MMHCERNFTGLISSSSTCADLTGLRLNDFNYIWPLNIKVVLACQRLFVACYTLAVTK
jgi:hypothetical protein